MKPIRFFKSTSVLFSKKYWVFFAMGVKRIQKMHLCGTEGHVNIAYFHFKAKNQVVIYFICDNSKI